MNHAPVDVIYYDGLVAKSHQAQIYSIDEHTVLVKYGDHLQFEQQLKFADMTLIGALGQIQPVIELKNDARIEFKSALPDWFNTLNRKKYDSIWKLERSPKLILFSLVFVSCLAFSTVKWGIPSLAHYIAFQLPDETLYKIGDESEKYLMKITNDSNVPKQKQQQIIQRYNAIIAQGQPAKIVFREGDVIGANALAIPNNTIVLTDELIELAKDDAEILGVLAHEQGHLSQKHSLQQSLTSLGFSLVFLAITGDSSDLVTSVPAALVGAKYSRDFESEADTYALNSMHKNGMDTQHFANFLERLEKLDEDSESQSNHSVVEFLQSHPATEKRIQAVKDFQNQHAH